MCPLRERHTTGSPIRLCRVACSYRGDPPAVYIFYLLSSSSISYSRAVFNVYTFSRGPDTHPLHALGQEQVHGLGFSVNICIGQLWRTLCKAFFALSSPSTSMLSSSTRCGRAMRVPVPSSAWKRRIHFCWFIQYCLSLLQICPVHMAHPSLGNTLVVSGSCLASRARLRATMCAWRLETIPPQSPQANAMLCPLITPRRDVVAPPEPTPRSAPVRLGFPRSPREVVRHSRLSSSLPSRTYGRWLRYGQLSPSSQV